MEQVQVVPLRAFIAHGAWIRCIAVVGGVQLIAYNHCIALIRHL
jgi:hypothetical protein